jgi:hypothetical protein
MLRRLKRRQNLGFLGGRVQRVANPGLLGAFHGCSESSRPQKDDERDDRLIQMKFEASLALDHARDSEYDELRSGCLDGVLESEIKRGGSEPTASVT